MKKKTSKMRNNIDLCNELFLSLENERQSKYVVPYHAYVGKEIMAAGKSRIDRPKDGSICTIFLSNVYVDETIDRSRTKYFKIGDDVRDLTITVGEGDCELDRGLDTALRHMSLEEESKITLRQNSDKSKEMVIFVKLIRYKNPTPLYKLNAKEKLTMADLHKQRGNSLFADGRIEDAFHRFNKAIKYVFNSVNDYAKFGDTTTMVVEKDDQIEKQRPKNEQDESGEAEEISNEQTENDVEGKQEETVKLYVALCGNMALCHMQRANYQSALTLCDKVLTKSPNNVKSLLRRADCYVVLKNFENARHDVVRALELCPRSAYAQKRLIMIENELRHQHVRYVEMVKRMFTSP